MNWQSDDWAEDIYAALSGLESPTDYIKAGANAMLEAVKAQGRYVENGSMLIAWENENLVDPYQKGWLVFIKDDATSS